MKSILSVGSALLIASLLIVFSCQKSNSDGPDDPDDPPKNIEYVTAGITGRVVDDNNLPVNGAVVKAGAASTSTDINGSFSISQVSLDKNAGFIKIEKDGFFPGSRTIVVNAGAENFVSVQLIKKTVSGTVSGSSGGNITVTGGGKIVFTDNSFINTAGNAAYTGSVSVSSFFLNPTASNFTEIMPGTLRGINTANEETGLQSFGMMAVELTGAGGEKLQLAAGKTATLTFPIPAALLDQAPVTIPLWSFNDTTGLWKEEGVATKQGTNYVGTVSHFSFWNCDYPYGVVDFSAVFKDQNGKPLYPAQIAMKTSGDSTTSYASGYTDSTGWVGGKIPKNKTLQFKVYSKCNTPVYTKDIGPFNAAANLGTVVVNVTAPVRVAFAGSVVNCNAANVTNGFVDIFLDNTHHRTLVTNGKLSISIDRCTNQPATAIVTPYDLGTNKIGSPVNVTVASTSVIVGQIAACGNAVSQYLNYSMNSTNVSYVPPADSLTKSVSGDQYTIWAMRKSNNDNVAVSFTANSTGTVPVGYFYIAEGQKRYVRDGTINLNITEFGPVGGYISGNLTGNVKDSFTTAPINLIFRIKR